MRFDIFLSHRKPDEAAPLRRFLAWLGPSWLQSPARRMIQALSLALFLVLFFWVLWPHSSPLHNNSPNYAETREAREIIDAESFLRLDPLVAISAALTGRAWVSSLVWAAALLAVTLIVPRVFCGYLCPLGTVIDIFDWLLSKRVKRFRVTRRGWWVHLKYYVLAGVMTAAVMGVMLSGFVAAMPVLTRGMLFIFAPLQTALLKSFRHVPPVNAGQIVSIALFLLVLALGLLSLRFWCRHVCPTGAVFSLVNLFRLSGRRVTSGCTECGKCVESCPFDAIRDDFTTRHAECAFCQTCGGACPARAVTFCTRWSAVGSTTSLRAKGASADSALSAARLRSPKSRPGVVETGTAKTPGRQDPLAPLRYPSRSASISSVTRRGFIGGLAGGLAAAATTRFAFGAREGKVPVRPPGSVPEDMFRARCVRCGDCVKACPGGVLRPASFELGLEGLWTPRADCDRAGCDPECNNCGQVCPTGAVRALPLEEKRAARMGLAVVDEGTCLPHAGAGTCRLCVDQCVATGYYAIEFRRVHVELDAEGRPVEGTGFLAPVVKTEMCVGCGLCQSRCYGVNVQEKGLLEASAITVLAGPGREDRITKGSYVKLREKRLEGRMREEALRRRPAGAGSERKPAGEVEYLPEFLR